MASAVKISSTPIYGGGGPTAGPPAPNVLNFQAGVRQANGTYAATFYADPLGQAMMFDPSSTPADCKLLLLGELRVWHGRSDTDLRTYDLGIYDASTGRSFGGSATPQAWNTLPTVPFVSVRNR